ncbi:hypothetical protein GCM10025762_57040 [Haloechinothrix salitolerans]
MLSAGQFGQLAYRLAEERLDQLGVWVRHYGVQALGDTYATGHALGALVSDL